MNKPDSGWSFKAFYSLSVALFIFKIWPPLLIPQRLFLVVPFWPREKICFLDKYIVDTHIHFCRWSKAGRDSEFIYQLILTPRLGWAWFQHWGYSRGQNKASVLVEPACKKGRPVKWGKNRYPAACDRGYCWPQKSSFSDKVTFEQRLV